MLSLLLLVTIYAGEILRVVDADTVRVRVTTWPDHSVTTSIRLLAVDAPELRGKCDAERELAKKGKAMVESILPAGSRVFLQNIKHDKYAGRYDAEVWTADGKNLAQILIDAALCAAVQRRQARGMVLNGKDFFSQRRKVFKSLIERRR